MLLKFGNFDLTPYMADDYKPTPNRRTDVDSYQDAVTGVLHRTTLSLTRSSISVKIVPMYEAAHSAFMQGLRNNYIKYSERDANCTYYDTESCANKIGHFYIDSNQEFGSVDREIKGLKHFTGFTLELVEY